MSKTAVSLLNEAAQKHLLQLNYEPAIIIVEGSEKKFQIQLTCKSYKVNGVSTTKKGAKHDAAIQMLRQLKNAKYISEILFEDMCLTNEETPKKVNDSDNTNSPNGTTVGNDKNYVGLLNELCQGHGLPEPYYELETVSGMQVNLAFTIKCKVSSTCEVGTSSTKKRAKQKAAEKVFDALSKSINYSSSDPKAIAESVAKLGLTIQNLNIKDVQDTKSPHADEMRKVMNKFKQSKLKNQSIKSIALDEQHFALQNRIQSISEIDKNRLLLIHLSLESMKIQSLETFIGKAFKLESLERVWLKAKAPTKYLVIMKIWGSPLISQFGIGSTREAAELSALRKFIKLMIFYLKNN